MKFKVFLLAWLGCLPGTGNAAQFDLATFTCDSYENQILNPAPMAQTEDAINFSMWLFGFAVGHRGDHSIYSNGLQAFGNVLDAACRSHPADTLLAAVTTVNPANANPMDLRELDCATFVGRHTDMARSDPDSARTIMMWLYGFSIGKSGGHVLDTGAAGDFEKSLMKRCALHPKGSLYDALAAARVPEKK